MFRFAEMFNIPFHSKPEPMGRFPTKEKPHEDDRRVCEAELATADGRKKELHIDARTGRIEKIKND
ncbi:MAG: hypothetical protein KGO52_16655 [Nitrospirota bacterium]|nr:hypothetical protein [Nitrospirota bacterium]MDE3244335.1 hypothetical protein [Nitrospirota bacterium]